ncbi:MAG: AAA family ATPase [Chloroflexi bacterium]|nr:AAA family ATPase [Chloroflexota bacterium]
MGQRGHSGVSQQSSDAGLQIYLLGRFEVRAGEQLIIDRLWNRRKAKALLKLLALQKSRSLHREQVLDALWPDLEPQAATNNLHKTLFYLRLAFAARGVTSSVISIIADTVALSSEVWVDIDEFRSRAQSARASRSDLDLYEQALELCVGDLLPEDIYEDWAEPQREDLRTIRIQLLVELSHLYEARGKAELAAERLQQLLQADPLHEEAHRSLMRIYAQGGSRHRVLRQYQHCRDILQRELGVKPSEETEALYREIIEGRLRTSARAATPVSVERQIQLRPPSQLFYGRERELEIVDDLMEATLGGHGQALFIGGVTGIGKSRFAQQILAISENLGALALIGRSYELEASVAYQPLRDMLQQALDRVSDEPTTQLILRHHHLKRLLPDGATSLPAAANPSLLQTELFNEASHLLSELAARQPLVLCFDDLHAADEASLRLVHFLCRQLPHRPILLIATYQAEAAKGRPLAQLLGSLRRERLAQEILLDPLPERAMTLLIEGLFSGQPVARELLYEIAHHAEGNPLFASELVHTFIEEGWARFADGRWQRRGVGPAPIPSAVQELLARRLQRLDDAAQQVLHIASVQGRNFDYELLRRAAQLPERDILDAMDDCIAAMIIEETADGYRFRHNLLHEGVYRGLTRARRQQLHRTIATTLTDELTDRGEADAEIIAYHFVQSDEQWRAVPYLQTAARRAASVFANEQALALYQQALAILRTHPAHAQPQQLAALLEELEDLERR